ncbi:mechanosensitive ion channel family protein [Candidatus Bathyarchaeota archaeon]|nr:mechanosensitive ion channel family protein [Candidatus Bathyarchaeota archaeon]
MLGIFAEYPYLTTIIWLLVVGIAAVVVERIITRRLKGFVRKTEMPPDVGNGLILTARLIIVVGAVVALLHVGGVPPDILVSFSALGGAAVGFASTRTIGNLIAGFYLLIARPFRVGDYVRIDSVEGVVQEITMNYAKILTPANTVVSISTQRILDKEITNYRFSDEESKLYCYGFELNFDHSLPTERLEELLDRVVERYAEMFPKKPEYQATKFTRLDRNYMFYIYAEDPKDIFILQPKILREIMQTWDEAKTASQ